MKFIKFLSLITIISYAPVLYSMEDNTLQEQSRVPKLVDLCLPGAIEQINAIINQQYAKPNTCEEAVELLNNMNKQFSIATLGLADELYNSNELFKHCIDRIIDKIWNQCQRVTGATLDTMLHEIRQNLSSRIPKEFLSFIEAHFCKQKGWHVPLCLKEFNNVLLVHFSSNSLLMVVKYRDNVVKYRDNRGELIDAKSGAVIKVFDNVFEVNFFPDSSLMFVKYLYNRGELIDAQTGRVIKYNVNWVYFSPDSLLMFVKYLDGRGELINTKTEKVIKVFNNVAAVNFSPDNSLMVVSYKDNRGELIDAQTGRVIKYNVNWVNFSPDSSLMFVKYLYNRGELIDAQTGRVIKDNVNWVYFSPDSLLMFVKYLDGRGESINTKTEKVIKVFNNVAAVYFSPDSSLMVVKYGDNRGELINAKTWAVIKEFNDAHCVSFSSDGTLLFVRYKDNNGNTRGELINAKTGEVIKDNFALVNFSRDDSLMFVKYKDNRGELLYTGNFEQIIFKCALRNTLKAHKEQQSTDIKQSLTTLLNHQILTTFPQQVQGRLSKEITDVLQDKDDTVLGSLEPPNKRQRIE